MNTSEVHDAALNHSPTGHYLLTPSVDPTFISVNDTFLKVASRTREELIGKKLFEVFGANPADDEDSPLILGHSLAITPYDARSNEACWAYAQYFKKIYSILGIN